MKRAFLLVIVCIALLSYNACKPDPRKKVTFKVDGISFILNTLDGITISTYPSSMQVDSSIFDKTIVTIRGRSQSRVAVLEFVLLHIQNQPVPDVYQIVNRQTDLEQYLANNPQACHGWLSKATITDRTTGAVVKSGRDPMGFILVSPKENNVYSINFDGFFTIFNDETMGGSIPAEVYVEATALIQLSN